MQSTNQSRPACQRGPSKYRPPSSIGLIAVNIASH
jgi:hypothetical protein